MKQFIIILFLIYGPVAYANKIVVGKGQAVTSIRSAIKMATPGDTVFLLKGIYKEGHIIIDKSLKLIGVGEPVLDGENKFEILTVSGENILIKGIHFKNSGYSSMNDYASITVIDARNVVIKNNRIDNSFFAIHIGNAKQCFVSNNIITGNARLEQTSGNGIHLWKCDSMVIENNIITKHRDGIYFEFVTNSIITGNNSFQNLRYGLHFMFSNNDAYLKNIFNDNGAGVAVMYSHHVLMLKNEFRHNWGANAYGILLKEISDATIGRCVFDKNSVGILMEGTNRINANMNIFSNNGWALKIQASCEQNVIALNNFLGNTFDVATNGSLMDNRFYNNYWDKYEGYDMNRDNVGDVLYHPVSMYSMVIEQNPNSLILLRSFMVTLLDKAEKAIPGFTPEFLVDERPLMKAVKL